MLINRVGVWSVVLFVGLALGGTLGAGCNTSASGGGGNAGSGGKGGQNDASTGDADSSVGGRDGADMRSCGGATGKGTTAVGQVCACDSDCGTGFCVDGVCCKTACTDKCTTCNLPGSEGTCDMVPAGANPRVASQCPGAPAATCGQDGMCDGKGSCRSHVLGTVCETGVCAGDGMSGINICDGAGACRPGPAASCFPYTCADNKCLSKCTTDKDCSAGRTCMANSCGKLPTGRGPCTSGDECSSGFCADGVCCNVACGGACVSCNQTGTVGQCRPVGAGLRHGMCAAQDKSTCGTTGVCDGFGSCALYPAETSCIAPVCAGNMANTAGTCDGDGTCRPPGQIDCTPFMCAAGSCVTTCTTDAQCVAPNTCVGGSCGKKPNGSICTTAVQCQSNQCVDGVCCDTPCTGACQSCALQSSLGMCKNVARGAVDPHRICKDTGAASCGTDGRCDGSGGCRKYAVDTVCGPETCVGGAYTPPSTCNASSQCIPPDSQTCAPFACNGSKCFETCTVNTQCVTPATCVMGSCGLKPAGAKCSAASECQRFGAGGMQYCAQGVCCSSACTTACQACNLSGSLGTCSAVANNVVDPQKKCVATAASTCGRNGRCRGGVCDTYHTTDQCKPATCSTASTSMAAAFCDGRGGACPAQSAVGCGVYNCDAATGACRSSCTTNTDCVSPNTCVNGSCGKKPNGASCSGATQCLSGNCTEGVCCNTSCSDATTGTCLSCKVANRVGTCSPVVLGGSDPRSRCLASARTSCGLNGTCDGAGKCDFWDTGIGCRAQSCTGTMLTNTASCTGDGACPAATTRSCEPYNCNTVAGTCKTTCTSNADCVTGVTCNTQTNRCGDRLPNGRVCSLGSDCTSTFCVKSDAGDATGVCCNAACTGGCQSCSLAGTMGACTNIAAGSVPRLATMCPTSTANVCGNTGRCNGAGACQLATNGTMCNDGNACTTGDGCRAGTCSGTPRVCTASDQCHVAGTCDMLTGACSDPPGPNGTSCTDGDPCNGVETCQTGTCQRGMPLSCTTANPCKTAGACVPGMGCPTPVNKAAGTSCTDGNVCNGLESCEAGVCTPGQSLTCTTTNPCKTAGACVPGMGCPPPVNKAEGISCADGDMCNGAETCNADGMCVAGRAVNCPAPEQCYTQGECNPTNGECSKPRKDTGAPCNDGDQCTDDDTCKANSMCSGTLKSCPADQCHPGSCAAGVCRVSTGETCSDGDACTTGERCSAAGACGGGSAVQCPIPANDCKESPTCERQGGCPPATNKPAGTECMSAGVTCDVQTVCTAGGVCECPPPMTPAESI